MNQESAIQIAFEFIRKWETLGRKTKTSGFYTPAQAKNLPLDTKLYPYPDGSNNRLSIGWGTNDTLRTNGQKITSNTVITKAEADANLEAEVRNQIVPYLNKNVKAELTENQYAALISVAYNAGSGAIKYNGLLDAINSKSPSVTTILKNLALRDSTTGQISSGLKNRRKDESMLWDGTYNELYSYYLRNNINANVTLLGALVILSSFYYWKKFKNK
jgi:GH24 family phage-related lysozyme (muramidase)